MFNLKIKYNKTKDLFTVDVKKGNDIICYGEPIIYSVPLFQDVFMIEKYPSLNIIPIDLSGTADIVTYDNFYSDVFLYVDNDEIGLKIGGG